MLTNLLASFNWPSLLLWVLVIGAIIALYFFNKRAQQKREDEINGTLNALKPGNKVTTIGGICGVVAELCEDGTFILETGSETTGKSYIKFDKKAIYQTDAKAEPATQEAPAAIEEAPESVEEAPFEEVAAPVEEAPVEEAPAEEAPVEEAPVEEVESEQE